MKNYSTQLAGQIGESLVVAELGKRGVIATAFSGNVPDIDILAYKEGKTAAIQVKAWRAGSVSFDAKQYLNITQDGDVQTVHGVKNRNTGNLTFVFVKIGNEEPDRFFLLSEFDLSTIIEENYSSFLNKHNGIRPRNSQTTHCSVTEDNLLPHLDNWALVESALNEKNSS